MLDPTRCDQRLLEPIDTIVADLLTKSPVLEPDNIMVVGAACRDIMQSSLDHEHVLRATNDVDVALVTNDWESHAELVAQLTPVGDTGIRFEVAGWRTDIMPFGPVENPVGTVTPPRRREDLSVWGFADVFASARGLPLPSAGTIRIPTIAGYLALKLAAWLDRSLVGEHKDATDIAATLHWYITSEGIVAELYDTERGQDLLIATDMDPDPAAARLLGEHVTDLIGPEGVRDLVNRWPSSPRAILCREMNLVGARGWSPDPQRRATILEGLEVGIGLPRAGADYED